MRELPSYYKKILLIANAVYLSFMEGSVRLPIDFVITAKDQVIPS